MNTVTKTLIESTNDISQLIAQKFMIPKSSIIPFADSNEFLSELFLHYDCEDINIVTVGPATPEILMAADKAIINVKEIVGKSAFSHSIEQVLETINDGDIVYIANPHKLSGANCSLSGLKSIVEHNKNGMVVIDEYYFDFFGISAIPLLVTCENIVILRSFAAPFGIYSSDAGFALSSKKMITCFKDNFQFKKITSILRKTILATVVNDAILQERLKDIHEESLRITKKLTALGAQCRITATDFLLIRVASPKDVGNYLVKSKIDIENLDGYPQMKKYLLYRIESKFSNDRLITAFEKMPTEFYQAKSIESKKVTLHRSNGEKQYSLDDVLTTKIANRTKPVKQVNDKHLFKIMD